MIADNLIRDALNYAMANIAVPEKTDKEIYSNIIKAINEWGESDGGND